MRSCLAIIFLAVASVCHAQLQVGTTSAYSIEGLSNQTTVAGLVVSSTAPTRVVPVGIIDVVTDAAKVQVTATDAALRPVELKQLSPNQYLWTTPGKVDFLVIVVDHDKRIFDTKTLSAQIPDSRPPPKPDDPKPDPPEPDGKLENLSVLMIYESAKLPSYSPEVTATINSTELRQWLSANIGKTNGVPNWRCLDKDTVIPGGLLFSKWLAMPTESLPWVVIGNETKIAFAGPISDIDSIKQTVLKHKAVK